MNTGKKLPIQKTLHIFLKSRHADDTKNPFCPRRKASEKS